MKQVDVKNLNRYIDHTLLKATATPSQIEALCQEALQHHFFSVCVNSCYVKLAASLLKGSDVAVCTVVGFPLGASSTEAKIFETEQALKDGATEIDMVLNVGLLKAKMYDKIRQEIASIKNVVGSRILKVILETCYLTDEEKEKACTLCVEAGADFVKTSTGFGTGGATIEDVQLMAKTVGNNAKVKASGGVKDTPTAIAFIKNGASRIGTSNGITIVSGEQPTEDY